MTEVWWRCLSPTCRALHSNGNGIFLCILIALDNAEQGICRAVSHTAPLSPLGTSTRGSQRCREKIWRRLAGHRRITLLCQLSHSAEYMLNSAAGLWPTFSFSSSPNSHQQARTRSPLHQTGWLVLSVRAAGASSAPHSPRQKLPRGLPLRSPTWGQEVFLQLHWRGDRAPLAEQAPTN